MAEKALQVATSLAEFVSEDIDKVWLGRALDLHVRALKLRRARPEVFGPGLLTSNGTLDVFEACLQYFSIYDLTSKEPLRFPPAGIELATLHSLMLQALSGPNLDCPLKSGIPFYCPSAWSAPDKLCVPEYGDGKRSECLLDVFERECGLLRFRARASGERTDPGSGHFQSLRSPPDLQTVSRRAAAPVAATAASGLEW